MNGFQTRGLSSYKKTSPWRLLVATIAAFIWLLGSGYQSFPILLYYLNYYPKLEATKKLQGRIEITGYAGNGRRSGFPRYFIVDDSGRHEFFCGLRQSPDRCFSELKFDGGQATIWFHPWVGVLQYEVKSTLTRRRRNGDSETIVESLSHYAAPAYYAVHFSWKTYLPRLVNFLIAAYAFTYLSFKLRFGISCKSEDMTAAKP
jgi:hypothetical protein